MLLEKTEEGEKTLNLKFMNYAGYIKSRIVNIDTWMNSNFLHLFNIATFFSCENIFLICR
jgi:hypothetical protein